MHRMIPMVRGLIAGLAITLVVAACAAGVAGGGTSGGDATIGFASPSRGATVSIPFAVELTSSVALAEPETGSHHAHIYVDTTTDAADYDIVYGTTWQVTRQLSPGEHTLTVALANADHSLAGPTQSITVIVGEGDAGAPPSVAPDPVVPGY